MRDIKLTLSLEEVNCILSALGDKPFVQVVTLIAKVRDQADPQVPKQENIVADELVD